MMKHMLTSIQGFFYMGFEFFLQILTLLGVFALLIAIMLYFTGFREATGKNLLIGSILSLIALTFMNMVILGNPGPPDILVFFNTGS